MRNWISRLFGGDAPPRNGVGQDVTLEELKEQAERLARKAGYADAKAAFQALDSGDLDGTLLETALRSIRFLDKDRELTFV